MISSLRISCSCCAGIPCIFLLTDGAVENERTICRHVEAYHARKPAAGALHARISTFAIGPFCNHFFLKQLAASGGKRVCSAACTHACLQMSSDGSCCPHVWRRCGCCGHVDVLLWSGCLCKRRGGCSGSLGMTVIRMLR